MKKYMVAMAALAVVTASSLNAAQAATTSAPELSAKGGRTVWSQENSLSVACSNKGTNVSFGLAANDNSQVGLWVVFAKPNVSWRQDSNGDYKWLKQGNNGEWAPAVTGDDFTAVDVQVKGPNVTSKKDQFVTGNPYIYYVGKDDSGNDVWYGGPHCNQGSTKQTKVGIGNLTFDWNGDGRGRVEKGSCSTTPSSSSAKATGNFKLDDLTIEGSTYVVYSNKVLTVDGGTLKAADGSPVAYANDRATSTESGDIAAPSGYHVSGNPLGVSIVPSGDATGLNGSNTVRGLGGNPNVWIGLGVYEAGALDYTDSLNVLKGDNNNGYVLQGRCKSL